MKLHIFNPEHEMALAADSVNFMLPHKIQEFRMNLGFLPALWAAEGDCVLVDDVRYAVKALATTGLPHHKVFFFDDNDVGALSYTEVEPWGWDKAVKRRLTQAGISAEILPSDYELDDLRNIANRRVTTDILRHLREGLENVTCGSSCYVIEPDEAERIVVSMGRAVVKSPWSSSGRGVRYTSAELDANVRGWIKRVVRMQGGVMIEPQYVRVIDFAMEFNAVRNGLVEYSGLSLFNTERGAYMGNIIATEEEKMYRLSRYIPLDVYHEVSLRLSAYLDTLIQGRYCGPLGVDMMVVANSNGGLCLLHPCVEINLRRTMGHVANSIKTTSSDPLRVMTITHGVNYMLRVTAPDPCFVKVI